MAERVLHLLKALWESEERRWVVSFRSPVEIWHENPTQLVYEVVVNFWALLIFRHGEQWGVVPE